MELINNRQVNLWRGNQEPPTKYHIWIKDNKLLIYNGEEWEVFVDNFSSLEELRQAIEDLGNSTINGKAIKDNPTLTSIDILIGKNLDNFKANNTILDVLESLDSFYSEGYPIKVSESLDGTIVVAFGNYDFKLIATGEGLSIRASDNTIIFNSTALTSINTEAPLEWTKEKKLIHKDSGVTAGAYGVSSDQSNASTFIVPHIKVDAKGHISNIQSTSVTIRDYVKQTSPDSKDEARPVLLAYDSTGQEKANPVNQASGFTYNNSTGDLSVGGTIAVGGGISINGGDLHIAKGYKIYGEVYGDIQGTATPKIHTSTDTEYGAASTSLYGHVIISDELGTEPPKASNTNTDASNKSLIEGTQAVAASPLMVWNAIETSKSFTKNYFSDDFVEIDNKIYFHWEEITQ